MHRSPGARREDEAERAKRQDAEQSFRMWPTPDGMVEGHFKVTPQVGARDRGADRNRRRAKKFRDARKNGKHEPQEKYAAEAFAEVILGDPKESKGGGWTAHVLVDHEALKRGHAIEGETCEIPGVGPVSVDWVRGAAR